ncbi:hypothetical protein [Spongorhabdus nitratireducens]
MKYMKWVHGFFSFIIIAGSAFASFEPITVFPHVMEDAPSEGNLLGEAKCFELPAYSISGVAGCCSGSVAGQARNIIVTENQFLILECSGTFATKILEIMRGDFLASLSITDTVRTMRGKFAKTVSWQGHHVSVASVRVETASCLKVYVDGISTAVVVPMGEWKRDLDVVHISQQEIHRFGGWCEGVKLLDSSTAFSYTNFLNSKSHAKNNPSKKKQLLQALELANEFNGYLSYTAATSHDQALVNDPVETACPVSGHVRLYIYTQGIALHPYEIVIENLSKNPEACLREISNIFLARMKKPEKEKDKSAGASTTEIKQGLAAKFGMQQLGLEARSYGGATKGKKVFMLEGSGGAIESLQAGWLVPQNDESGLACVIVDINPPPA